MNINAIESKRENLLRVLNGNNSPTSNLISLSNYLSELLKYKDIYLTEAFFKEFIKKYLSLLSKFEPSGLHPDKVKFIVSTATYFLSVKDETELQDELDIILIELRRKNELIKNILEGHESNLLFTGSIRFPVIEQGDGSEESIGFVEEIKISINKNDSLFRDKFVVVPNLGEIEVRLEKQINNSWMLAKKYLKHQSNKINSFHDVVIQFEKKYGLYIGESLGIALTIGFIQEFIKYYNLRRSVIINSNIASTGGIDENEKIKSVSESTIKKKIDIVFFTDVQKFIVPQNDYTSAQIQIKERQVEFPKRQIQLVGVETINDLFNRRDLIDIKKQNFLIWSFKKIIKNYFALSLLFLFTIAFGYFLFKNLDNNPVSVEFENNERSPYLTAFVKNKYGNIIWIKSPESSGVLYRKYPSLSKKLYNITDINDDGKNEVFLCRVDSSGALYYYNNFGDKIWDYVHHETLLTKFEIFSDKYIINSIVDVIAGKKFSEVLIVAEHSEYYPNIVLKLNAETGEPLGDNFYHAGGISGAELFDLNFDGGLEVVASGISYGYDKAFLFTINYDSLGGTSPSLPEFGFKDKVIANFDYYLLLPRTDLGERIYPKLNPIFEAPKIFEDEGKISISTLEDFMNIDQLLLVEYNFSFDFKEVEINFNELFISKRDKLIELGKLKKPYTDTREYRLKIISQIMSWNGKSFTELNSKLKN
jgi:hypothetical protein